MPYTRRILRAYGLEQFVSDIKPIGVYVDVQKCKAEIFETTVKLINGMEYRRNRSIEQPIGSQIALITDGLERDYARALAAGAVAVTGPDAKPWGQSVAYVRDNNGFLVELCTPPISVAERLARL